MGALVGGFLLGVDKLLNITYKQNALTPKVFADMRELAGWGVTSIQKAETAIKNTPFSIVAFDNDTVVGIGRIIGDGALIWYIQDVVVLPKYRGRGIGTTIVKHLINYAKANSLQGERFTIGLMSTNGNEAFYQRLGFRTMPNEDKGHGMEMYVFAFNL